MADEKMTLEVFRYNPEEDTEPRFQNYEVPYKKDWVILDALNWVKDNVDGTLTYRWSCRMGVCGSCGMQINGVPKLTCAVFLKNYYPNPIRVEPLANFPVIRDLVIEMDGFMEKLKSVKPWIIDDDEPPLSEGAYKQTPAQLANFKQFSMCINCMLCYAACPVMALEPDFLGPAAIALGQRYNLDSRDKGNKERNEVIFSHEGIWDCTFVGECTEVCPKKVDPAGAIQQAKVDGAIDMVKSVLMPWGKK
ncbi:MAG: succinate dehydrogenase/fumarate reductase iron-sulfur subunit [Planctomycetota bacterium]|nr:succinate dehydrogenase/fumarate reductase iron-sulfur subunit [Planctomycetota bacterium]MDA1140044.1 succinate dehydrogenase/fumarate reductase iron-sulfur subunit [Planctomycetota bacterium]